MRKALSPQQWNTLILGGMALSALTLLIFFIQSLLIVQAEALEPDDALAIDTPSTSHAPSGIIHAQLQEKKKDGIHLQPSSRAALDIYAAPNRIIQWPSLSQSVSTPDRLFSEGLSQLLKNQYEGAQESFHQALEKTTSPLDNYRLGERFAATELYTLAAEAFQRAEEEDPQLQTLVKEWRQDYLPTRFLNTAQEKIFLNTIYGAIPVNFKNKEGRNWRHEQLKQLIQQVPDFAPAHRWLGLWSSSPKAGLPELREAVLLSPGHMQSLEMLGDGYARSGQYAQAAQAYTQALQSIQNKKFARDKPWKENLEGKRKLAIGNGQLVKNPRNAQGWHKAGEGLLQQNRPLEARQALQKSEQYHFLHFKKTGHSKTKP